MNKPTFIVAIFSVTLLMAIFTVTTNTTFAQNQTQNQTETMLSDLTGQNETAATLTGQPETVIINRTVIPAEQTNVTVEQTTEQVQGQSLQPIGNQNIVEELPTLSQIENQTTVQPTGPATTTIVNMTEVPFQQATVEVENATGSSQQNQTQQQPQQNQTQQQPQQNQTQQQPQQNQSQGQVQADQARIVTENGTQAVIDTTQNATIVEGQQQQQGQTNQTQGQQQQQNQGPLEQLGETVTGIFQ